MTEFSLFGEKLHLSPILDLCSSDLVSYTISDRPVLSMVTTMLDEAFAKIPVGTNLILHWQLVCQCCGMPLEDATTSHTTSYHFRRG